MRPARVYWYDDRIEIMSPGGVFGSVTAQNFGQPGVTAYRNPNLAEAMRNLRLVQRFGLGIPLAKRLLREAGHPDIEFDVDMNNVLVTIRARGKDNGVPACAGLMTAVAGCSRGVGARHVVPLHCKLRCKRALHTLPATLPTPASACLWLSCVSTMQPIDLPKRFMCNAFGGSCNG